VNNASTVFNSGVPRAYAAAVRSRVVLALLVAATLAGCTAPRHPAPVPSGGPAGGDPAVVPVDDVDLDPAVRTYRAAVAARLGTTAAWTRSATSTAACCSWPTSSAALCGSTAIAGGFADRCGYGPRLPMLVISPWSKRNYVDHTRTDQSSVLRFIETNWLTGRIGGTSFDSRAGSLFGMLNFFQVPQVWPVVLDPTTGAVVHH
jgi:hypothetical protein